MWNTYVHGFLYSSSFCFSIYGKYDMYYMTQGLGLRNNKQNIYQRHIVVKIRYLCVLLPATLQETKAR